MPGRLEEAYRKAERICIDRTDRIVCMSDCHRGVGNHGDNFLANQHLYFAALQYYYARHFLYIELGDGDELWENRNLSRIVEVHSDVFWLMSKFYCAGRLQMLYGNHDLKKRDEKFRKVHCRRYYCDYTKKEIDLFAGLQAKEGIVLTDKHTGHEIFLVHGHQGELLNDVLSPVAAFLVRFVWKPLEMMGIADPTSAARNYKKRKKTERRLEQFAWKKQIMLIAGHTHRPVLSKPGESFYMNDGSCVHPRCITALELENGAITLVKWAMTVRRDGTLAVSREILEGPVAREDYWQQAQDEVQRRVQKDAQNA